jgi:hypothetical protein
MPAVPTPLTFNVKFQITTGACMTVTAFWDMAPCSLAEAEKRFTGEYCLNQRFGSSLTITKHLSQS